jgi:pimeloyl-ACP methyl ester carboxylesterase
VDRLVLGDIGPEIAREGLQRIRGNVAARDTFTSIDDAFTHQQALNPRATDWALRQRIEHNLRELPDGTLTWRWDAALRDGSAKRADFSRHEIWELWPKIEAATLIVRGEDSDVLSPEIAERMLATNRHATLATIPGAGHTLTVDQPDAFVNTLQAWLAHSPVAR